MCNEEKGNPFSKHTHTLLDAIGEAKSVILYVENKKVDNFLWIDTVLFKFARFVKLNVH